MHYITHCGIVLDSLLDKLGKNTYVGCALRKTVLVSAFLKERKIQREGEKENS